MGQSHLIKALKDHQRGLKLWAELLFGYNNNVLSSMALTLPTIKIVTFSYCLLILVSWNGGKMKYIKNLVHDQTPFLDED